MHRPREKEEKPIVEISFTCLLVFFFGCIVFVSVASLLSDRTETREIPIGWRVQRVMLIPNGVSQITGPIRTGVLKPVSGKGHRREAGKKS
jgi:hypothetical protein